MTKIDTPHSLAPMQEPGARADLWIEEMRAPDGPTASIGPHSHRDLLQLIVATGGSCLVDLDGVRSEVAAPCLIAIPGGTMHGFDIGPGAQGWNVLIRHDRVLEVVMNLRVGVASLLAAPCVMDLGDQVQDLSALLTLLMKESRGERDGQALCLDALLRLLLVHLARLMEKRAADPRGHGDHALFLEFRALVERRFTRTRQIADYAAALNTTPARLNALCRRYAHRNAKQVVMDRLIDEARRRLLFSGENAADIALSLGFSEPSYFVRMFRKRTGATPGRFRLPSETT
ncbi:AraC-like DNA-binding protein [Novosphingobium sp. SG751A]|uniref:AraC family transcriptional regulator n=1 Tax=Novosphingobium sp. SG751A TaxID=2587000 RepID=UPI0015524602|nr:AraC family transcriptional regulator [Novosphingobium sp. SG751A]NOW47985.1 AraC-like DNA-binding protein [Novosphingobium sp. SG751A]